MVENGTSSDLVQRTFSPIHPPSGGFLPSSFIWGSERCVRTTPPFPFWGWSRILKQKSGSMRKEMKVWQRGEELISSIKGPGRTGTLEEKHPPPFLLSRWSRYLMTWQRKPRKKCRLTCGWTPRSRIKQVGSRTLLWTCCWGYSRHSSPRNCFQITEPHGSNDAGAQFWF